MAKIKQIEVREILNAQGKPTVETTVILSDNSSAFASVPQGTATGTYEAYQGAGVQKLIGAIRDQIAPKIIGMEADRQAEIDRIMIDLDGTQNKSRLGAHAMISVSMAAAKAAAQSSVLPLFLYLREFLKKDTATSALKIPTSIFGMMNGGTSSAGFDFKELLLIPASSKSFSESLQMGTATYAALKNVLLSNDLVDLVSKDGGFSPNAQNNQDALSLLKDAIDQASLRIGFDAFLGIDADASSFYKDGAYHIKDNLQSLSAKNLIAFYAELNKTYRLLYIEDPLSQEDWDGWVLASQVLSSESIIVGDKLTATNLYRLQMALDKKAITGVVVKPSQIGTVMESLAVIEIAKQVGLKTIVSNRGEETNDDFIADFAVAASSDYMKMGAPVRGENVAKYNRLLQIENHLKML